MSNCPNCGAPITGPECEYCGTIFGRRLTHSESLTMILDEIDNATITPNEARQLLGLKRRKEIENALKGPYGIKW